MRCLYINVLRSVFNKYKKNTGYKIAQRDTSPSLTNHPTNRDHRSLRLSHSLNELSNEAKRKIFFCLLFTSVCFVLDIFGTHQKHPIPLALTSALKYVE